MAAAHANMSGIKGQTVSIYALDETTALFADLPAIVRSPSQKEQGLWGLALNKVDVVCEIAKQGGFDGSTLRPHAQSVKFGDVFYEIVDVRHDDALTSSSGALSSSVVVLALTINTKGGGAMAENL